MSLITDNNLGPDADAVYTCLLDAMQGMDAAQASRFNARLVLLLLNQVGDPSVIREAIRLAHQGINEQ